MATLLRVMIVEDEPLAVRRLVRLMKGKAGVEIVAVAENGGAALEMIATARPNLLLLDVEMPGLNGFELIERLPSPFAAAIVFVTAFDGYAHKAFGVRAADFVLKPVVPERLEAALVNARRDLDGKEAERKLADLQAMVSTLRQRLSAGTSPYDQEFWIQQRSERVRLRAADIDWIEADKDYVRLHAGSRSFMMLGLIAAMERKLDPREFLRIHRSAIVRLERVRSIHRGRYGALDIELADGPRLRVGRKYAAAVRDRIAARA